MIQMVNHSLPAAEAQAIAQWIRSPAALTYRKYISLEAARLTAEAGNALVHGNTAADGVKAKDLAAEAAQYRAFIDLMDSHRSVDHKFEISDLTAKHTTT